ncbi:MAG TPA: carbamate kinase, partial [Pseudonocardiaceae bacterium]
ADVLAAQKGWTFRVDGAAWRRVVPSPEPRSVLEILPITWLLERQVLVICAGGGGIPITQGATASGVLSGVEAVIDKDLAGELVARDVGASLFVMATDVDGVYVDWGSPGQRRIDWTTPEELSGQEFAAGSMAPKVAAACRFARHTGRRAVIGSLDDIGAIVRGDAGTSVMAGSAPVPA